MTVATCNNLFMKIKVIVYINICEHIQIVIFSLGVVAKNMFNMVLPNLITSHIRSPAKTVELMTN